MRDKRSLLNFGILIIVAVGATIFILDKAEQAVTEASALADYPVYALTRQEFSNTNTINTSTWKIYRNEQYGFEVKYPPDWGFEIEPAYDANSNVIMQQGDFWFSDPALYRVFISPLGLFGGTYGTRDKIIATKNINLNGTVGRWREFADADGISSIHVDELGSTQDPQFEIAFIATNARSSIEPTKITEFDAILSTFKFIK